MNVKEIVERHQRIALQFSGGKDSLALLYQMRPYWDRLTVYWLDTGDSFPETHELVEQLEQIVPHFERIEGRQPDVILAYGIPADIVPANATPIGIAAKGSGALIQDRYSCCMRSLMLPMHERMKADGITLVIRGQKASDRMRAPIKSGHVEDGIEYLFPLEGWDDSRVFAFLHEQGIALPRYYEVMRTSPDCMTCSAYWEDGRAAYLKRYHPEAYEEYQRRLNTISDATAEAITHFNMEIGG
ncbi:MULTISPECIES: phosphoadenosine phosphosulfate reductase family protein [Burkholderia]|uniref:Phosphoadenosine phosphosulfate reductase n=1 Tax=Burkholderia aenigmatica TaxID=2015348 RepID=A0A6J5JKS3_9BURK|nr:MULTISPECIES: phosphoadenosine phosphosulfate reductase family protein [Burkholderia]CAB3972362.1 Phosphoadenosine phosphosulfate reductase [Burkholderia aenigmatica]